MNHEMLQKYVEALPQASKRKNGAVAEKFLRWLKDREPNKDTVEKYLNSMREGPEPYAAGTIHVTYDILRRMFIVNGMEWPFRRHEAPLVSERDVWAPALAPEVIKAMIDVCMQREMPKEGIPRRAHRAFLLVSTLWGLRRVEMLELSPDSLDVKNKLLFVETAKRGRQRYHMIPDVAIPILEAWGFEKQKSANSLTVLFHEMEDELRAILSQDRTIWADIHGKLLYVCENDPLPPEAPGAARYEIIGPRPAVVDDLPREHGADRRHHAPSRREAAVWTAPGSVDS